MPSPSKLKIATDALNRLVKEEASYDLEAAKQATKIKELERADNSIDEDAQYELKQLKQARQETVDLFPANRARTADAYKRVKAELETAEKSGSADPKDIAAARSVLDKADLRLKDEEHGVGTADASNP